MQRPPPGWAPSARRAADLIEPLCVSNAWTALLVLGPPLWGLFFWARLARATLAATRPAPGSTLSWHGAAARLSAGTFWSITALLVVLFATTEPGPAWGVAFSAIHFAWLAWAAALWSFLFRLSRPHTPLRRLVTQSGAVWLGILSVIAVLSVLLQSMFPTQGSSDPLAAFAMFSYGSLLLAQTLLLPSTLVSLLGDFWTIDGEAFDLDEVRDLLAAQLGAPVTTDALGLHARIGGDTISLLLARAPGMLVVTVRDERLPTALQIVPRAASSERVPLSDPLLDGFLSVSGLSPGAADALLSESHDLVLPVFHAWPDARLGEQVLRIEISGPPFAGCGPSSADLVAFIAERLSEGRALVGRLVAPSAATRPEDVAVRRKRDEVAQ